MKELSVWVNNECNHAGAETVTVFTILGEIIDIEPRPYCYACDKQYIERIEEWV